MPTDKQTDPAPELLPCPFCGAAAGDVKLGKGHGYIVGCGICQGQQFALSRNEAVRLWNTRTRSPVSVWDEAIKLLRAKAEAWREEGERWQQNAIREEGNAIAQAMCYSDRDNCFSKMSAAMTLALDLEASKSASTPADNGRRDSARSSQLRDALFDAAEQLHSKNCVGAPFSGCRNDECSRYKLLLTEGYLEARKGLEDEIKELRSRHIPAAGMDTAWPMHDVLAKLIGAHKHLHDVHQCDCHGYEEYMAAADAGKSYLPTDEVAATLAELREMFPDLFGRITRQDNEKASAVYIGLHRRTHPVGLLVQDFAGKTISEAMQKVREWKEQQ